jgi:hypothetical protein
MEEEMQAERAWGPLMTEAERVLRQQFKAACFAGRLAEAKALVAEHGVQVAGGWEEFEAVVTDAAGCEGHLAVFQWAVAEHGVVVNGRSWKGWRSTGAICFDQACRSGHLHVCQWLVDQGVDPHDRLGCYPDREFRTAVKFRHWAIAWWLVQREPEYSAWPAKALAKLIAQRWSPSRDVWMRSVVQSVLSYE